MCSENNQNQEKELEQIIASSPNYRTEEEAIALAGGLSEEEAIALASSGGSTVDRQAARAAVAGAFREEVPAISFKETIPGCSEGALDEHY